MEELIKRRTQLKQAYKRLRYMAHTFVELSNKYAKQTIKTEENELYTHRDALIKRFEFCYDLTWKYFKLLLKKKYSIDVTSPRKVFQECYQQGILSREETQELVSMIEARNETAHVYDESMADVISKKIVRYYELLEKIMEHLDH